MSEKITPFGRGEQIGLERDTETLGDFVEQMKEALELASSAQDRIIEEYGQEMAKPEWARNKDTLERLKGEFADIHTKLERIMAISQTLSSASEYIGRRYNELEDRKIEKGY